MSLVYVSGLLVLCLAFVVLFITEPYTGPSSNVRRVSAASHFVALIVLVAMTVLPFLKNRKERVHDEL